MADRLPESVKVIIPEGPIYQSRTTFLWREQPGKNPANYTAAEVVARLRELADRIERSVQPDPHPSRS